MSRKLAREAALSLLYEYEIQGDTSLDTIVEFDDILHSEEILEDQSDYIESVIQNYKDHSDEVDSLISEFCVAWKFDRLSKVDISILRLATVEMLYLDIPIKISVNESVELAKKYSSEKSPSFVNGVLAGIIRKTNKGQNC